MPNLGLPEVTAGQNQKTVTIVDAQRLLDDAITKALALTITDTNVASITADQLRQNQTFSLVPGAPAPDAPIVVTVEAGVVRGTITVINTTAFDATVEITSQPVTSPIVAAGATKLLSAGNANIREPEAGASLEVQQDDVSVATDVTTLNVEGALTAVDEGGGKVTITGTGGGGAVAGVSALANISQTYRGALVNRSAVQSIPTATQTLVAWDQEARDTDGIHDNAVNNTRLTVPSGVTKVSLRAGIRFDNSNTAGVRRAVILKNGDFSLLDVGVGVVGLDAESANDTGLQVFTDTLDVVPGDYFEVSLLHTAGVAINLDAIGDTWFSMEIVETIERSNLQSAVVGTKPKWRGATVSLTAIEAIPGGSVFTAVPWDQVTKDTDSLWSAGTPTRLTVPEGVSKIHLRGAALWDSSAFTRSVRLTKNGAAPAEVPRADNDDGRAGDTLVSQTIDVVPGDYFELECSSSSATNIITNSYFEIELVEFVGATDFPTGFIAAQPRHRGALVRLDADKAANTVVGPTDWDSAAYDTAFDPKDGGPLQRFWLGPDLVVTFTNATNTVNATAHGMVTGEGPIDLSNAGGAVPTGLAEDTPYWWIADDANSGRFASSRADALADTEVAFTTDGTGTTTMERADRLVVPAGVTKIGLGGQLFTTATTGRVVGEFEKNGSVNFPGNGSQTMDTAAANERSNPFCATLEVVEGDVFKLRNFVDAAVNLEGNDARTWATIEVVEDAASLDFPGVTVDRPYIGTRVRKTAGQTLTTAVAAIMTWEDEDRDTGYRGSPFHDNVTNNSRLTVPAGVTKVRLGTNLLFSGGVGTFAFGLILKNGLIFEGGGDNRTDESANRLQVFSDVLDVVPGDYFEVQSQQNSGGNLDVVVNDNTWFAMEVVETEEAAFVPEQVETGLLADGAALAINHIEHKKVASRRFSLNDDLSGSVGHAGVAPTVTAQVFDVKRNGTIIGTITFAIASQTATFATTGGGQEDFAVGDRLTIETQGTVNTVIRDVAINLMAFRS